MDDATTTPGDRLRLARAAAGLSQASLAARLGCRAAYVSDVERGRRTPTLDWLWEAADRMGANPRDLDSRLEDRPPGA